MPIHFDQPYWFVLLPVIALIYFGLRKLTTLKKNTRNLYRVSVYLPAVFLQHINSERARVHKTNWINWLIIILMTAALAQPVSKERKHTNPDSLRDIIFVIDTSVGMSIRDYKLETSTVDRLTLLKAVLTDFIHNLEGNRIALMVYADQAYALSPLTRDKRLLSHSIKRIQPAIAGRQNNLSNALNSVINQYDFSTTKPSIVVLSQGANIEGNISPIKVAESFKARKIKLHFIGLGSTQNTTGSGSGLIFDPIDNKLLQTMAETTGGEFFWAGKSGNLNYILNAIRKTETIDVHRADFYLITNYFIYILYLVLTILLLSTLFNLLRSRIR